MPKVTALIHADDSTSELNQTVEQLSIADDILIIADAEARDKIRKQLHHKARVQSAIPGVSPGAYAMDAFYDWVLIMRPGEKLSAASTQRIEEWKHRKRDENPGYTLDIERDCLRLINRRKINWTDELPPASTVADEFPAAA